MKGILVVVLIVIVSAIAWADYNGQWLHDFWLEYKKDEAGSRSNTFAMGVYVGFVSGVAHTAAGISTVCDTSILRINWPDTATGGQLFAIVGKYLDAHPEKWDLDASLLVITACREAWSAEE